MPMQYLLYPSNWHEIATEIKAKADWRCQACGRPCRPTGQTIQEFIRSAYSRSDWFAAPLTYDEWREVVMAAPQRWTLTVAHLDHNPANCAEDNLRALCAVCHLRYDAPHRARQAAHKRHSQAENRGQLWIDLSG